MRSRLAGLVLTLGLLTAASDAAVIPPADADLQVLAADGASTVSLSQFDPRLGTLNTVFTSDGTVGSPSDTVAILDFTGGASGVQANLSALVGETFHIEYEYSPVPEPSTCGWIAGLGCLVALARRVRS